MSIGTLAMDGQINLCNSGGIKHMKKYVKATSEEKMSFREWLDFTYYPGFYEAASGLSDEEYYELEDAYQEYLKE